MNPLDIDAVADCVAGLGIGLSLRYVESIDSTNRLARELAAAGADSGSAVITDYQTAGRGRGGRFWVAPPRSSVLLSLVLDVPEGRGPIDVTMLGALAVGDAVRETTGAATELKWPNDVLLGGKKICGILAEVPPGQARRVILGMGINVNFDPGQQPDVPATAGSLSSVLGFDIDRERLICALFKRLDMWYSGLTAEPDAIFRTWASRLLTVGRSITVHDATGSWRGVSTGVQRDGALVVRDEHGETRTIYAADVSIRQEAGFTGS